MHLLSKTALTLLVVGSSSSALSAQTMVLQGTVDNTLYESPTGAVSNGMGITGYTGGTAMTEKRRYLIQFDVAGSIPSGATITDATFEIEVTRIAPGFPGDTFGTHRVLADWGEGTSNAAGQGSPSTTGDATWIHTFFPGTFWGTAGGDFNPIASSTSPLGSLNRFGFSSSAFTAEVQDCLDNPATDFGWMIKGASEGTRTALEFAGKDHIIPSRRPTLAITFTTPGPTTFCDPAPNNSSGVPAVLTGVFGSGVGSDLHLDVSGGPLPFMGSGQLGYFLVGNQNNAPGIPVPLGDGPFCLVGSGGSFGRYNISGTDLMSIGIFDASGNLQNLAGTGGVTGFGYDVSATVQISGFPTTTIMTGDTYHFQCWYRDTQSGVGRSNFTNGLSVTF